MTATDQPGFDAFISYSHANKADALRIQRFLESFPLPAKSGVARRRLRVFRDDTDIRAAELTAELGAALMRSRALIVCCSPTAAQSAWVQQEVDLFTKQDRTRPVLPIVVAGDPSSALPASIAAGGYRYVDARRAWRLGFLHTRARDELVRVVATLAGEDLRTFIPWDRRRRRARIAFGLTAVVVIVLGSLFVPFEHQRSLGRPPAISAGAAVEFCDVVADKLVLATRETQPRGTLENPVYADYVSVYPDAIGDPKKHAYINNSGYLPSGRLLHIGASRRVWEFTEGIDLAPLRRLALEHASALPAVRGKCRVEEPSLEPGYWAAAPAPNLRIALVAVKPAAFDPDAVDGPPQGASVVAIKDGSAPLHMSLVPGLSPPTPDACPGPPIAVALGDGLPLVVTAREVFIGMPMRKDGGAGALWRWDRVDKAWTRQDFRGRPDEVHANVFSLVTDPRNEGRVLLSTAPGSWFWNARKGEYAAEVFERKEYGAGWHPKTTLPIESRSAAQLCGFRSDATLLVRVNQTLFETGPSNLLRLLLRRN